MGEIRYAILVGINDYVNPPLTYCVNDVCEIASRLTGSCNYLPGNIYQVTSEVSKPMADVDAGIQAAFEQIKQTFTPEDSILFYFSGHGNLNGETFLELHAENRSLQSIFHLCNSLIPKNQIYIIDACHSGHGVELKSSGQDEMQQYYTERYQKSAGGVHMLCSCKEDETSKAVRKLDGGVYTHYLLQAIDNQTLYDKELGSLSLAHIHEYAAKKISLDIEYQQTPFHLVKSSGYYPFAFLKGDKQFSKCVITINIGTENDVYRFMERPELNFPASFKRDFAQFLSELALNLFNHNFSTGVQLKFEGNAIEIHDYSPNAFDPFTAAPTTTGKGIKVYGMFLARYQGLVQTSYEPGAPNIIKLIFDESIYRSENDDPCYFIIEDLFLTSFTALNNYNFNVPCDEITLDISKALFPLSFCDKILDGLLERTKTRSPLIILKMDGRDLFKEDVRHELFDKERFNRFLLL